MFIGLSVHAIIIIDHPKPKVFIIHFREACPPLLICVKWASSHVIYSMWLSHIAVALVITMTMFTITTLV